MGKPYTSILNRKGGETMKHFMISSLLCFSLSLCTVPAQAVSFTDTGGHWAESQIESWTERGIVHGYKGKFEPNAPISRGDVAAIIDRIP